MIACLKNRWTVPLIPTAPCVMLKPRAKDLSCGKIGSEKWTGETELFVNGAMSPLPLLVELKADCWYTSDVPLTYA